MQFIWGTMEVRTLESESSLILYLKGILDTSNARDLEEYFETRISSGYKKFVLDCSHLDSLSSGGISLLLRLTQKMKSNPEILVFIAEINQEVTKLLRLFGLEQRLRIFKNTEEAKDFLAKIPSPQGKIPYNQNKNTEEKFKKVNKIQFYYKGNTSRIVGENSDMDRTSSLMRSQKWSERESSSKKSSWEQVSEKISTLEPIEEKKPLNIMDQLDEKINHLKVELKKDVDDRINKILEIYPSNNKFNQIKSKNIQSTNSSSENFSSEIIHCESCGTPLRVKQVGRYSCPNCSVEFYYTGNGSTSFLEKLL
jgi:anti-sigma B factor antagonist